MGMFIGIINQFQYQMSKNSKKIIDSVSASELLKALNALQNMSELDNQAQISFCEDSKVKSQYKSNNGKVMNYEQYMAKKEEGKQKIPCRPQRKSISPLKEDSSNLTIKINNLKSRSHSPLLKRPEKTERSMLVTQKKIGKPKENKENKREEYNSKNQNLYRASFQSKKILDEKQKKGSVYVPIQFRTGQLLKEKQVKLAKLQKEKQIGNILREKQCTFKPNIIKNYKKAKPSAPKQDKELKKIEEESARFDSCGQQNEFLCTPTQAMGSQAVACEQGEYLVSNCTRQAEGEGRQGIKKYKNDKFNFLLDLIH